MTNETLSDKINIDCEEDPITDHDTIYAEDVKDFIQKLKERLPYRQGDTFAHLIIDKLAGDDLI